ncbi:MAG: fimbria/pilus outer membrane usher protein [Alkalimonas sp.]|nr:fimbria/pilus outer membrane usher protein [Alkalimonas sp.]
MPSYSLSYLPDPHRLVIDLHDVDYLASFSMDSTISAVTQLRGAVQPRGTYRLVIDTAEPNNFICSEHTAGLQGNQLTFQFTPVDRGSVNNRYQTFSVDRRCDPHSMSSLDSRSAEETANLSDVASASTELVGMDSGPSSLPSQLETMQLISSNTPASTIREISVHDDSSDSGKSYIRITSSQSVPFHVTRLNQPDRLVLDLTDTAFHPLYRQHFSSTFFTLLLGEQLPSTVYRLAFESKKPMQLYCTSAFSHGENNILLLGASRASQPDTAIHLNRDLPDCNLDLASMQQLLTNEQSDEGPAPVKTEPDAPELPTAIVSVPPVPQRNGFSVADSGLEEGLEFDLSAILGHSGLSERQIESLLHHGVSDGDYLLDISINGRAIGRDWVRVYSGNLCFSSTALLSRYVQQEAFTQLNGCFELPESQTAQQLDPQRQRLNLVLSEQYLLNNTNGFQRGGTALALNYNLNYRHSSLDNSSNVSGQTELRAFANNWILQSRQSYFGNQLYFNDSFVQRDFTSYGLRFQAGRIVTSGFSLDGYRYDGIRLQSNNQQIQGAMQGRIEGTTMGPATVTISQNGSQIYQSMVPGGDYVLSHFQLRNTSSPLLITEQQDDGTENSFEVPARLALPERFYQPASGVPNYYVSLGVTEVGNSAFVMGGLQLDSQHSRWQQAFDLAVFDDSIVNAGARLSHYSSQALQWDLSYRLSYASQSNVPTTGQQLFLNGSWTESSFSLAAGMQYNSRYFVNPLQRMQPEQRTLNPDEPDNGLMVPYRDQPIRYNLNLSASYSAVDWLRSRFSLGWFWQETYSNDKAQSMVASWGGHYARASFSAGYSKQLNSSDNYLFYADLRIPFGQHNRSSQFVQRYNESANRQSYNAQLSSRVRDIGYSLGYSQDLRASRHSYNASVNTPTPLANVSASYSRQGNNDTFFVNGSGSIVATPQALAIGPNRAGDTLVLVSTRDIDNQNLVRGVPLQGQRSRSLLSHSLDTSSSAYRARHISLNQSSLQPSQQVVYGRTEVRPMAGTVLHQEFLIRQVNRYLLNLTVNGERVPALSHLFRENGDLIGVTDHRGQIFISDSRIRQHHYFIELPDGTECQMTIDWSSIRDSGNEYFQTGEAQCEL